MVMAGSSGHHSFSKKAPAMKQILILLLVGLFASNLVAQEEQTPATDAINALRQGNFEKAIEGLSGDLGALAKATKGVGEDELNLHLARAHQEASQPAKAISICDQALRKFPKSKWRHKIVFLKAEALASQRKFDQALAIYQSESKRIFDLKRQDEVAGQLVEFAELFATEPAPEDLDAPAADYGKALILYGQVLDTECSDGVRESVRSRMVELHGKLQKWQEAEKAALAYLDEFDSLWLGPLDSIRRLSTDKNSKAKLDGAKRFKVRFHHAEALHRLNRRPEAVRYLGELEEMTKGKDAHSALRADATWLRLMAMTQNGAVSEVDDWVKEAREYLALYPNHIWAPQVAFKIGSVYAGARQWENARGAYQDYLDGKGYLQPGENPLTLDEKNASDLDKRKRNHEVRREAASFEIGAIFLTEKKFNEAEARWNKTAKDFPNGEKWAECQKGLVRVDFERALEAVRKVHKAKKEEQGPLRDEARKAIESFLTGHPLDARLPQLMFVVGELSYHQAIDAKGEVKFQLTPEKKAILEKAIADWRRLISKYPQSPQAKAAELKIGGIYEHYLGDLEKAVEIYSGLKDGAGHKSLLMAKVLKTSSSRVFGTEEKPEIKLELRNVEEVEVRQYWIDFESFFMKSQDLADIENLDVDLVEPDKTWKVKIPGFKKFLPMEHNLSIPFENGKAGVCVIKVEGEDLESTTVAVRSDIDLAVRYNRMEAVIFVRDWKTGKVAPGVRLVVADGAKIISTGETGEDGVWHYKREDKEEVAKLRILAVSDRGMAGYSLSVGGLKMPPTLMPSARMLAARNIHRPGEEVNLNVIVRDVKDREFVVPGKKDRNFTLKVTDHAGRLLKQSKVTLNDMGSSLETFRLPDRLGGDRVNLSLEGEISGEKISFSGAVMISHQGLPWVNLGLEFEKEHIAPGEVIKGKVVAEYRWGAPLVNRKVRVNLPGGLVLELQTDGKGEASFEFPTEGKINGYLNFQASIPSTDARSVSKTVHMVTRDYVVTARGPRVVIAEREFEVALKTLSLDGKPVARKLKVVLERPVEEHPDPVLVEVPGLNISHECVVIRQKVAEQLVETDGKTGKAKARFKISEGGTYSYQVYEGDRRVGTGNLLISDAGDFTKLRLFDGGRSYLEGETAKVELHSRLSETVPVLVVLQGEQVIEYRVMDVKPGSNEIKVALTSVHAPGFRMSILALDQRKFHQATQMIYVKRNLKVEMKVAGVEKGRARPGQKVKVSLSVKDAAGKPVRSETGISIVRKQDIPIGLVERHNPFRRSNAIGLFYPGSSCGFHHQGRQHHVSAAIRQELQRQQESNGLARYDAGLLPQTAQQPMFSGGAFLNDSISSNPSVNEALQGRQFGRTSNSFGGIDTGLGVAGPIRGEKSYELRSKLVQTNDQGEAIIEMKLPNDSDQWVIIGDALGQSGALGSVKEEVEIREELVLKVAVPSTAAEGDSLTPRVLTSRLNADAAAKGALKLTVIRKGKEPLVTERGVTLKKGQQTLEVGFPKLEITKEDVRFEASLTVNAKVSKAQRPLNVRPWGAPVVVRGGILAKPGKNSFTLDLPKDVSLDPVEIVMQPGVAEFLNELSKRGHEPLIGDGVPLIGGHPAPGLLSRLATLGYANARGGDAGMIERLKAEAEGLVAALVVGQGEGGGWSGHVGRKKSDIYISAIGFEALLMARDAGIIVDQQAIDRAEKFLRNATTKSRGDDRALIQSALSSGDLGDFSSCNRLFRSRAELSAFGKAHLAMAFIHLKRPEFSRQLLENIGQVDPGDTVTLGRALQGWAAIDANHAKAHDLEKMIWSRCGALGFVSDLKRALGTLGLASLYQIREANAGDYRYTIAVNGNEVAKGDHATVANRIKVPTKIIKQGKNEISILLEGKGRLRAGTTITGVRKDFPKADAEEDLRIAARDFLHPGLTYNGLPLSAKSQSPLSRVTVGDRIRVRIQAHHSRRENGEIIIWEKIPSGFGYLEGSLSGAHSGARIENGYLIITHVGTMPKDKSFYYEMVAKNPGEWRVAPTTMFPIKNPELATYGPEGKLVVLPKGKRPRVNYVHTVSERFELATLMFRDGLYQEASTHLAVVRKDHPNFQAAEVARMTLWIETASEKPNAQLIADAFEVLNELSPELEIPFEKILKVGNAYRELKEFERGGDVFLASLEAGFATESFVGAALEDQGRFLDALNYQKELWMDFPDYGEIANSYFALAQQVYAKAAAADSLTPEKGEKEAPKSHELYELSVKMIEQFRLTHPSHPLADDGAFTIANALFTLKSYEDMVKHAEESRKAYPKSDFAEAFQYLTALGNFWLRNYDQAFAAAKVVAEGDGKDRNLAAYICAQILHAQGKTVDSLKWYEKVKDQYPDAGDSIAWFEQKKISLDEVRVIRSGEKVELELKHRNIEKADLQIYRVDLMKLYLREKNLSNIAQVNLAGISPKHELSIDLKNEKFGDQETTVDLPMKKDGAYLVICRGDYLYASGLVLVTPLKMETQEDVGSGSVRVNMTDRNTGGYLDAVHVKAIGSNNSEFITGETDLRGVWKAEGVKGRATVIARDQNGRYAFYRGEASLGRPVRGAPNAAPDQKLEQKLDYNFNNSIQQDAIWSDNSKKFDKLRRSQGKGVKVNKAIKK